MKKEPESLKLRAEDYWKAVERLHRREPPWCDLEDGEPVWKGKIYKPRFYVDQSKGSIILEIYNRESTKTCKWQRHYLTREDMLKIKDWVINYI